MKTPKNFLIGIGLLLLLGIPIAGQWTRPAVPPQSEKVVIVSSPALEAPSSGVIEQAYRNHAANLPVTAAGVVSRILPDDNQGSRHQRFIVQLASGHTILIAHNIDIAPRIAGLNVGDAVTFSGQYEWNDKGGVVHWTHHDPSGRHPGGYVNHNGMDYR